MTTDELRDRASTVAMRVKHEEDYYEEAVDWFNLITEALEWPLYQLAYATDAMRTKVPGSIAASRGSMTANRFILERLRKDLNARMASTRGAGIFPTEWRSEAQHWLQQAALEVRDFEGKARRLFTKRELDALGL